MLRGAILGLFVTFFAAGVAWSQPDPTETAIDQALLAARPLGCSRPTSSLPDEAIAICRGIDIGRNLVPSTVNRLSYADSDAFDRALGRSLRNRNSSGRVVTVSFSAGQLNRQQVENFRDVHADTQRIMPWLARIDDTGGQIKFCTRGANGQLQGFNLLTAILTYVLDMLQRWTLYQPAGNYHARVVTEPVAGSGATPVLYIEFIRRNGVNGQLTCTWTNS